MPNQQLIDYINQAIAKGYSGQQVRDLLVNNGWNPLEVDEALNMASSISQPSGQTPNQPISEKKVSFFSQMDKKKIVLAVSIAFLVVFSVFLIIRKMTKNISLEKRKEELIQENAELIRNERVQSSGAMLIKGTVQSVYDCGDKHCIDIIEDISQKSMTLILREQFEDPQYNDIVNKELSTECIMTDESHCEVKNPRRMSIQGDEPLEAAEFLSPE